LKKSDKDRDHLNTADMAAAGQGATMERERIRVRDESDVELRPGVGTPPPRTTMRDEPVQRTAAREESAPLFSEEEGRQFRTRWEEIQTGFVDEPRHAVERADELVAAVMKRLAEVFADERSTLERQWTSGDNVSTEDLRIALRRYRSFFDRLLTI
jgi:hypothetical protein